CDLRREALQLGPDEEGLAQLRAGQRADANAPVGLERDEAERRQPAQRLPDRCAADAILLREPVLAKHRSRGELARHDRLLELERDVVRLGACRLAHGRGVYCGRPYRAVQPRSITTGAPVNARPPGPSRNAAVSATSSGSSRRLTACGASSTSSRTRSGGTPVACACASSCDSTIGVRT